MYTKEQYDEDMKNFLDRRSAIKKRADSLVIINENVIIVERLNIKELATFLFTDARAEKDNMRTSTYGKVLKISQVDTGDDIKEIKKKLIKEGDFIRFNPETAYHLNIPGFYELWCIGIDNILDIDLDFNHEKMFEQALSKRLVNFSKPLIVT